ncbi:hypothetical protein KR222_001680 [Zaprionus bogoriensis]|nr:hypothetical protein KR222_001680 [Zaprionus bogoriensis]
MSDLSYLDAISNKELHAKCLEYGLPNIPVTDSSRQVILRRLRATILGVPLNKSKTAAPASTRNTKPRRETIHSSKATPAQAPEPVAAAGTTQRAYSNYKNSNNSNSHSRRTIAATPSSYYPLENSSGRSVDTTTTVSDVGSQSEDDDFYTGSSPGFNASRDDVRQRRSVSLTKSGVLTTSYTREVEQPRYEDEEVAQSYTYQRPQVAPTVTLPAYEPRIERTYRSQQARQPLTQTLLNSTSYSEDYTDYNEQQPVTQQQPRNTYTGSAGPFTAGGGATTTSARQRQSVGISGFPRGRLLQPTFQANKLYPQLNEFYDQHNSTATEAMDVDTDSEPESELARPSRRSPTSRTESPYLSTFSRQLDARKQSSPLARPQARGTIAHGDLDSPKQQFLVFIKSLDQQYHIKFYFFLTLAVVLATLVYVILTP